jgi:hypothetical protein
VLTVLISVASEALVGRCIIPDSRRSGKLPRIRSLHRFGDFKGVKKAGPAAKVYPKSVDVLIGDKKSVRQPPILNRTTCSIEYGNCALKHLQGPSRK